MPRVSSPLRPDWSEISEQDFRELYQQITSRRELAAFWGCGLKPHQLSYYAFYINKRRSYETFRIPRRYGGERRIDTPVPTLKFIQRLIHESLTRVYRPDDAVHGFLAGRSIVTNARRHLRRRYVLNIDLADFFPSINRKRIYGRLVAPPYSLHPTVANAIAALSTNAYARLPQGSPSSPVIANMVAAEMDSKLNDLCTRLYCRYTRYADDITISTRHREMPPQIARYPNARGTGQVAIGDILTSIIESQGFKINHRKSRLQSYWTRQMCTGLVVNGEKPSPPRSYIRHLRSLVHHWKKKGWREADQVLSDKENRTKFEDRPKLLNHVKGRIGYLKMVRGQDDPIAQQLEQTMDLLPPNY